MNISCFFDVVCRIVLTAQNMTMHLEPSDEWVRVWGEGVTPRSTVDGAMAGAGWEQCWANQECRWVQQCLEGMYCMHVLAHFILSVPQTL